MSDEVDPFGENTIGMKLFAITSGISQCAAEAQTQVDLNDDPSGVFGNLADQLWQIKAMTDRVMTELGVKTPEDMRKINAHDYPDTGENEEPVKVPF